MANATTRAHRLTETKMILRQPLLLIAIILSFALLLLFVIYPLAKTLIYSLRRRMVGSCFWTRFTVCRTRGRSCCFTCWIRGSSGVWETPGRPAG